MRLDPIQVTRIAASDVEGVDVEQGVPFVLAVDQDYLETTGKRSRPSGDQTRWLRLSHLSRSPWNTLDPPPLGVGSRAPPHPPGCREHRGQETRRGCAHRDQATLELTGPGASLSAPVTSTSSIPTRPPLGDPAPVGGDMGRAPTRTHPSRNPRRVPGRVGPAAARWSGAGDARR